MYFFAIFIPLSIIDSWVNTVYLKLSASFFAVQALRNCAYYYWCSQVLKSKEAFCMSRSIIFEPIKIGKVPIKNKIAMAPMGAFGLVDESCCFNQRAIDYYVERAKGGTGLIITSVCKVENELDQIVPGVLPCTWGCGQILERFKLIRLRVV